MARPAKRGLPGQLSLLDVIEQLDRSRGMGAEVKAALVEDLQRSRFPRPQVAARMSVLVGQAVTVAMLDAWTAQSKGQHRMPLEYGAAWVQATEQQGMLRLLVRACGGRLVMPDQVRRELGQVEEERRRLADRERTLRSVVAAVDEGVLG